MKIVKSFVSPRSQEHDRLTTDKEFMVEYGLGDDGSIYFRTSYYPFDPAHGRAEWSWKLLQDSLHVPFYSEMKLIVKEFDHLIPFI